MWLGGKAGMAARKAAAEDPLPDPDVSSEEPSVWDPSAATARKLMECACQAKPSGGEDGPEPVPEPVPEPEPEPVPVPEQVPAFQDSDLPYFFYAACMGERPAPRCLMRHP